jgi:flavin reductase (DIM6/NTAB) family NADH-FMN oxidoreductase RutF
MSDSIAALFQRLTQGVYVVGVAHGEVRNAFTAAWVMQVSFDPLLLALSINPHHSSYGLLKEGRAFSVNVLKKSFACWPLEKAGITADRGMCS